MDAAASRLVQHLGDVSLSPRFVHENLQAPDCQIRLLRITSRAEDYDIACRLETFDAAATPPYTAVSYTWGDASRKTTIRIDGRTFDVTLNCHDTLRRISKFGSFVFSQAQVVERQQDPYLWIDSICINQADIGEKNCQVAMMGRIYESADSVLAFAGDHYDDSELLLRWLRPDHDDKSYGRFDTPNGSDFGVPPDVHKLYTSRVQDAERDGSFERMAHAFKALSMRPYANRLWVVQEVALARSAFLFIGDDYVPFHMLAHFQSVASFELSRTPGQLGTMFDLVSFLQDSSLCRGTAASRAYLTWEGVVHAFPFRLCAEPRDRLYGLSKLVNGSRGLPPLPTDYSIGILQVVVNYLTCYEAEGQQEPRRTRRWELFLTMTLLLEALRLSPHSPDIAGLISSRRSISSMPHSEAVRQQPKSSGPALQPECLIRDSRHPWAGSLLQEDGNGNLYLLRPPLVPSCASCSTKADLRPQLLRSRMIQKVHLVQDRYGMGQGIDAAYTFCLCHPGDYLVPLRFYNVYRARGLVSNEPATPDHGLPILCVILRPSGHPRYNAVGFALIRPALFVELSEDGPTCVGCKASTEIFRSRVTGGDAPPMFRFFFTAEDLVVLTTFMLLIRDAENHVLAEEMTKTPPVSFTSYAMMQSDSTEMLKWINYI